MNDRDRDLDIRIRAASATGFWVQEGEATVAAFSTAADLCFWLEAKLALLDPKRDAIEPLPRVVEATDAAPNRVRAILTGSFSRHGGK